MPKEERSMLREVLFRWPALFGLALAFGLAFSAAAEPVTYVLQTPGVV
jgi:hypothetical protein